LCELTANEINQMTLIAMEGRIIYKKRSGKYKDNDEIEK
jgi:hypothetical protein